MKLTALSLLATAALFSAPVHAQDVDGAYLGFAAGLVDYEEDVDLIGVTISDSTSAYRIVGGYRFGDNLALEAGWGASSDLEDTVTVLGAPVRVRGDYEVLTLRLLGIARGDGVSLYGGVGYFDSDLTATGSAPGFGQITTEGSETGATLVGGLQFDLQRVSIRTELEWFDTDGDVKVWDASVGVLFRF